MKVLTSRTFKGKYEKKFIVSFRIAGYANTFRAMVLTQPTEKPEEIVRDLAPAYVQKFEILEGEKER